MKTSIFGTLARVVGAARQGWRCYHALAGVFASRKLLSKITAGTLLFCTMAFGMAACDNGNSPSEPSPTVTEVRVSAEGDVTSVDLGDTLQFHAQVIGANSPPGGVEWSITTPGIAVDTEIDQNGLLTVASDETVRKLTVKATSTFDDSKSGVATVDVRDPELDDLEGDITISPAGPVSTGTLLTASYTGDESVTYQWYWADGAAIDGETSATFTPYWAGVYTITVSAIGHNPKSATITITGSEIPPENRPDTYRWSYWTWESTATVDHFEVGTFDGQTDVCKITIGGTAMPNNEVQGWGKWKTTVEYSYTAKSNTFYVYQIKAWTDTGTRSLAVQWYNDNALEDYRGDDIWLTPTQETHTYIGEITKGGVLPLAFQCADQLGTFYVKVVSITEFTPELQFELIDEYELGQPNPNNDTYRVVSGLGMTGAVNIPDTHNNVAVTEIGWDAFRDSGITSVTIPASVNAIRGSAFDNSNKLASVTFAPDSQLAIIESFAFGWCSSLTSITIPASVERIGGAAFTACNKLTTITVAAGNSSYSSTGGILYNSNKTELVAYPTASGNVTNIPTSVTTIGGEAFAHCENLTGVTIPTSVDCISWYAFAGCQSIHNITIPASVTSIDRGAFSNWIPSQTITIQGYSNQAAADAAWGSGWRADNCNANIVYAGIGVGAIRFSAWREGNSVTLNAPTVNPPGGISAQGWQTTSDGDTWADYNPPVTATLSDNGKYLRYYATIGGQEYYSNVVPLRVLSATEQEVTIEMRDDYGDGWNGAALRVNVNGVDLPANATLDDGNFGYYWLPVNSGDEVKLYWISGDWDGEISFDVYYSDDPDNLLIEQHSGNYLGNGTLMGEFTVP